MKKVKILFVVIFLLVVGEMWGQPPADSLTSEQVDRLRTVAEWKSKWDIAREASVFLLPLIAFVLGGLATYLGIRNRFQKWAEEEITKKASEKVGVDWAVVKQLVDEKNRDAAIKAKRLAIEIGRAHV